MFPCSCLTNAALIIFWFLATSGSKGVYRQKVSQTHKTDWGSHLAIGGLLFSYLCS
jgi:hypothetical protein